MEKPNYPCGQWAWLNLETGVVSPFKCGKANCVREVCKVLFWSRRVRLIQALVDEHSLNKFFTLTLDRSDDILYRDPWTEIHHVWLRFRKRMNRRHSGDFRYVSVLEAHKNRDWPHIHGFTNIWMEKYDWTKIWSDCGGGRITWIEAVKSKVVGKYVGKELAVVRYVGKEQLSGAVAHSQGKRTLWRSRGTKAKFELTTSNNCVIVREDVYDSSGKMIMKVRPINGEEKIRLAKTRSSVSK